ncbi:hypothetical protein ABW19_dt0204066 [Dactylella cylindrospora]|nr:hypothetical protein ABW19_dt0204066 [Dactylella cylindrospora]
MYMFRRPLELRNITLEPPPSNQTVTADSLGINEISGFYGPGGTICYFLTLIAFYIDLGTWLVVVLKRPAVDSQSEESRPLLSGGVPAADDAEEEDSVNGEGVAGYEIPERDRIEEVEEADGMKAPITLGGEVAGEDGVAERQETENVSVEELPTTTINEIISESPSHGWSSASFSVSTVGIETSTAGAATPSIELGALNQLEAQVGALAMASVLPTINNDAPTNQIDSLPGRADLPPCPGFGFNVNFLVVFFYHLITFGDMWKRLGRKSDLSNFGSLYTTAGLYEVTSLMTIYVLSSLCVVLSAGCHWESQNRRKPMAVMRQNIGFTGLYLCVLVIRSVYVLGDKPYTNDGEFAPRVLPPELGLNISAVSPQVQKMMQLVSENLQSGGFKFISDAPGTLGDLDQISAVVLGIFTAYYSFRQFVRQVIYWKGDHVVILQQVAAGSTDEFTRRKNGDKAYIYDSCATLVTAWIAGLIGSVFLLVIMLPFAPFMCYSNDYIQIPP